MFVKYQNSCFKDENFSKRFSNEQLLIYAYLYLNRTLLDEVNMTILDMVQFFNYKSCRSIDRIVVKLRNELYKMTQMQECGYFEYIKTDEDILNVPVDKFFKIKLGAIQDVSNDKEFTRLTFEDLKKIATYSDRYKEKLLVIYLYIKSFIFERPKDKSGAIKVEDIEDKPEGWALSFEGMAKALKMGKSTIKNNVKLLQELNLITSHTTGGYTKDGGVQNAPNIYVLYGHENEIPLVEDKLKKKYGVTEFIKFDELDKRSERGCI